jgi:hypothetical protein
MWGGMSAETPAGGIDGCGNAVCRRSTPDPVMIRPSSPNSDRWRIPSLHKIATTSATRYW